MELVKFDGFFPFKYWVCFFKSPTFKWKHRLLELCPLNAIFALQINIYIHVPNCTTKDHQNLVNLSKSRFISESRNVVNKSHYRKVMEKNIFGRSLQAFHSSCEIWKFLSTSLVLLSPLKLGRRFNFFSRKQKG